MRPYHGSRIGLIAALCCTAAFVTPVFAQSAGDATVSCGQFTSNHRFGETEFGSDRQDFDRCSKEMTTPGFTLVDVLKTPIGPDGNKGVDYAVVCQCTKN